MSTQIERVETIEQQYPILFGDTDSAARLGEALAANVGEPDGGAAGDLDRITMPAAGALQWSVPGIDGEQSVSALTGIIVAWRDTRAHWAAPFGSDAAKAPPQCSSLDAVTGAGDPGGACLTCPHAQWHSSPSGTAAQACRLMRQIYLLPPGMSLPVLVLLPPSSVATARRYLLRLTARSLMHYEVVSQISLVRETSATSIRYSRAEFTLVDRLSPDQCRAASAYIHAIQPLIARQPLVTEVQQ